jgi:hypothetical protein
MAGGVTNYQMTENAKVRQMVRHGMSITSAQIFLIGEFPEADIAIKSIRSRVEDADSVAASAIDVGHGVMNSSGVVPDPDSLVAGGVIADDTQEGEVDVFALAATLVNPNVTEAHGFPIVPKGAPIYMTCDATPTTGTIALTIDFFPLDEKNY